MGQSYLTDPNIIGKIVTSFCEAVPAVEAAPWGVRRPPALPGHRPAVVELGPGLGALTGGLYDAFPDMTAVELDARAVDLLRRDLRGLDVLYQDILDTNFLNLAAARGPLNVVGNLPYHVVSDILLALVRPPGAIRLAVVMVQKEVAEKLVAPPSSKQYSILSAMVQLYAKPKKLFTVPPGAFYPRPKVTSAVVRLDFVPLESRPPAQFEHVLEVVRSSFQQRGKRLRHSLKQVLARSRIALPAHMEERRAEQLTPQEFADLTQALFPAQSVS